jgi:hypothetical protein
MERLVVAAGVWTAVLRDKVVVDAKEDKRKKAVERIFGRD